MATLYRARWVLPIEAPPIHDGWVLVRRGVIAGVGAQGAEPAGLTDPDGTVDAVDTVDLGESAVLPGLVNAHTHLELSWMRGRVAPGGPMPAWAERLMTLRRSVSADPQEPVAAAIREARGAGTALVGDVTNTLAAWDLLAESGLPAAVFREVLGFSAPDPAALVAAALDGMAAKAPSPRLRASVVPHAPYSVSPALFRAIADASGTRAVSVHLAESAEEMRFLRDGSGPWRELLGRLGAWNDAWQPPACGPVEYLDRLGLLTPRLLAVHGTQLGAPDLARLAAAGATLVTCPRSNRWTGAGIPPIAAFYASGVRVAMGTDSLASVEDLSLFAEMAAARRLAPEVPAARLLASATWHGAEALGFGAEYGRIAPGLQAALIAVRVPAGTPDVEEYLVGGIEPPDIRWL